MAECHPDRPHSALGFCKPCYYARTDQGREASRKARATWVARNPRRFADMLKAANLKRFGITLEQYREMVVGQAGRCLICLRVPKDDLCVDHDHATGMVRGLLCKSCNLALGSLRDSPRLATAAAKYLTASAGLLERPTW